MIAGTVRLGVGLVLAMGAGPFLVYSVSALGPDIIADIGLSTSGFGFIPAVFYLVGGIGSLALRRSLDLRSPQQLLRALFSAAALASVLFLASSHLVLLLAGAAVAGISLLLGNPATNRMIAELPAGAGNGLIVGVKQSGVSLAQFAAGFVMPSLAMALGWNRAFLLPLLVSTGCAVLVNGRSRRQPRGPAREPAALARGSVRGMKALCAFAFSSGLAASPAMAFLVLYAHDSLRLSPAIAGLVLATVGVAGMVGRIAWAPLAQRSQWHGRLLASTAVCGALSGGLFLVSAVAGWVPLVVGGAIFGLTAMSWNTIGNIAVLRRASRSLVGSATSLMQGAFFLGFVVGPIVGGLVIDLFGYPVFWLVLAAMFVVAAVLGLLWDRRGPSSATQGRDDAPGVP